MRSTLKLIALLMLILGGLTAVSAESPLGYYRQPALHGDTLVFVAEGDLWKVSVTGGVARRLTSHAGDESMPAISADGETLAFVGMYEGPRELYTMPLDGGRPARRTYGAGGVAISGWTPDGEILYGTQTYSTLPAWQLVRLDISNPATTGMSTRVPLYQAADGSYSDDGRTLFFTRLRAQGSHTKRYMGGTAQNIWRFSDGDKEATPLTPDYAGTSKRPLVWNGRIYFATDRDGTMNLWSMLPDGSDLQQHTRHDGWDIASPYLSDGRVVYQLGADIYLYDITSGQDRKLAIYIDSDLDQTRENWIDEPLSYLTSANISPDGDSVVLTARGRIFVAPHRQGRIVEVTHKEGVRNRGARFMPDGERVLTLSDESGEVELWTVPANGVGDEKQLTDNGDVLRWEAVPSPDGKWIVHNDKNHRLSLYDVEKKKDRLIEQSMIDELNGMAWSPDSRWIAYAADSDNSFDQIKIYEIESGESHLITTDRYDSWNPVWSVDGEWIYLLSDRHLESIVGSPWGSYQPEPYLDKMTKIYHVALKKGLRSPFQPPDELQSGDDDEDEENGDEDEENGDDDGEKESKGKKSDKSKNDEEDKKDVVVEIDFEGIEKRLQEVSVPAGNYVALSMTKDALFWLQRPIGERQFALVGVKIGNEEKNEVKTLVEDVRSYDLSMNGKKVLVRKSDKLYIVAAKPDKAKLEKQDVNLNGWNLSVIPQEEWRAMFIEAWRLERDYFYDPGMHGVNWKAMLDKYLPLVDRVTTRSELSNLIAQMVSELSALHIFVGGGDLRRGDDAISVASLAAVLTRDESGGGYRVEHIYQTDPDEPDQLGPLARPGVDISVGDVILLINGRSILDVPDYAMLLRGQAGRQVLLRVEPVDGGETREVIVEPVSSRQDANLRYHEWEYTRRLDVEERGEGKIGYLHLRAMGRRNYTEWAKGYFPVFTRQGLIIDVRNNRGGNIDSWILSRLLRRAWFGWSQRIGQSPSWNMQYAFRGHIVVLCNERTASDGEAFSEGIKQLDIGTVIGTRTWGGEIWLTSSNVLVDRGIATAAEFGVFGPEGDWLIEGHGVEPDIVVDNLPHETFEGKDAQLEAAVEFLKKKIAEEPIPPLETPDYPDKSLNN
jgi:tricorn protease